MTYVPKKALLLIGSPRGYKSASAHLGNHLVKGLEKRGWTHCSIVIPRAWRSEQKAQAMLRAMDEADLLILATPLYVDSLPAPVTRTLEAAARRTRRHAGRPARRMAAIVNCGLPDPGQNDTAISICRLFAREAGIKWVGGLSLGQGEALQQKPLKKHPVLARNVIFGLNMAARSLAKGRDIPYSAVRLMARPMVPWRLYTWLASVWFYTQARKFGATEKVRDQPLLDP